MNRRANITLETSLLIAIVVAALLSMRTYLRVAIQGNWKKNIDTISDEQYRPRDDTILNETDPVPSKEIVSNIKLHMPTITVKNITGGTEAETLGSLDMANRWPSGMSDSGSGILHIDSWGRYYDPNNPD